jgi:hypothetical protein
MTNILENTELKTIELEGFGLESPVYSNHKRSKNWGAIVTGKNAANAERSFPA